MREGHEVGHHEVVDHLEGRELVDIPDQPEDLVDTAPSVDDEEDAPLFAREGHAVLDPLGVGDHLDHLIPILEELFQAAPLVDPTHTLHDQVLGDRSRW